MADTRVQVEVEDWVRRHWMPEHFGESFYRERVRLSSGGVFDFDAVNKDVSAVANISTSSAKTSGGKHAVGKVLKVRSDIYFLLLAEAKRRICVLTEEDMYDFWIRERQAGRVPNSVEFSLVRLPAELRATLMESQRKAAKEVSPKR